MNRQWRRLCFRHDPQVGWWWLPDIRAMIPHGGHMYLLRTNSRGLRSDREYPPKRPPGRKRIILLGDSYTAGDGVDNGQRYSDMLERKYPRLDVMNFGLPNSGTDQQVLIYETLASGFEADAVVLAVLVENILRNRETYRPGWDAHAARTMYIPKPYFVLKDGCLEPGHQPVPIEKRTGKELNLPDEVPTGLGSPGFWDEILHRWYPGLSERANRLLGRQNRRQPYPGYESADDPAWRLMRRLIERLTGLVGDKPLFIMPLPTYHFFDTFPRVTARPVYLDRFMELDDPAGGRYVVDPLPLFKRLPGSQRQQCCGLADPHYTPMGHRVVAEALAQALSRHCPRVLTPTAGPENRMKNP